MRFFAYPRTAVPCRLFMLFMLIFSLSGISIAQNVIVTENALPGNPASEWDISGAGDLSIQGFATELSVNKGETVRFKIKTDASDYGIDIYRLGYYNGNGARKTGVGVITASLPQLQPAELQDEVTGLTDCGNWMESAHWDVPADAVSGIYIAKLKRADTKSSSHIVFIVRDDAAASDLLFQTSDGTWQAYNGYGGNSFYTGTTNYPAGHAVKISYNRPFITRGGGGGGGVEEDWLFNAEYPMIRWLEKNGYDVRYTTSIDVARSGSLLLNHKVFMSVGHDEYWSAEQRNNVEAARDVGVHLAFFSGNEIYWKTRFEPSIDGTNMPYRTLVCYKEGNLGENECGGKCDPLPDVWTGLWRSGCDFQNADGCRPENALSGQISWDGTESAIEVPSSYKSLRFWRNTSIADLGDGQTATLSNRTLGYEWDWEQYPTYYPAGRIKMSATTVNDHTHHLSLYRHPGGALVFGAGTVQWSWGLDGVHDRGGSVPDNNIKQATVNLFADMGVQPGSLESGLIAATASTDQAAPASVIGFPVNGATIPMGKPVTISGTATDSGGGVVAGVEVSTDGGLTWSAASGTANWSYTFTPSKAGDLKIQSRSADDICNLQLAGSAPGLNSIDIHVSGNEENCPCSIFSLSDVPVIETANDHTPQVGIEVGVKFKSTENGFITGFRFYKGAATSGAHSGQLWTLDGTLLGRADFINESSSGWQEVQLGNPVSINAGEVYVATYFSDQGYYAYSDNYFNVEKVNGPLIAIADPEAEGGNGVYSYTSVSAFPINSYEASNYWADVVFSPNLGPDTSRPVVLWVSPLNMAEGVNVNTTIVATFNEKIDPQTVNGNTCKLKDAAGKAVSGTVAYDSIKHQVIITPTSPLKYSTNYQVTLKSGNNGIKDVAGNALLSNLVWTFTTSAVPPPPITEGPGGPVLIISGSTNPFSRFPVEILRAQGMNEFDAMDISMVTGAKLKKYDVVILGNIPVTKAQGNLLAKWTMAGGTLIAFRPDPLLAKLFGLTPKPGTLQDKYLLVHNAEGPGAGIVHETIQFHGAADLYRLKGATAIATLYSDANTATTYPAVTTYDIGTNGGRAIAFTYDLARSIVYTRQGNPQWAGQKRDGQIDPIRSDDMFFPDWVDFNKIAIPQADEQQHLLTNIIIQNNLKKKPLPRFWFLPRGLKAAVVMTGDDHGNGGTTGRFNQYKQMGPNDAESVANWTAVRATSYIFPGTPISDAQAKAFQDDGFEIALHLSTNCENFTPASLENNFATQLPQLAAQLPGLHSPVTNRNHCITWSDWATVPKTETAHGIRLDANYYYWPASWVQDRPGMFTGSGLPMRFADLDGSMIDCYQLTTQMPDESGLSYSPFIDALLDKALGAEGYYGVFCANMHTDDANSEGSDLIIASAQARQVPVISSKQLLTWLDGRNGSSFGSFSWNGNTLGFSIAVGQGANYMQAMLPVNSLTGQLISITRNGENVAFTTEIIKGIEYAFFPAVAGNYVATYSNDAQLISKTGPADLKKANADELNGLTVTVSPNPSSGQFKLMTTAGDSQPFEIKVVDVSGRSMYKAAGSGAQVFQFGETFIPGIYFIQIRKDNKTKTIKIVKTP